MRNGQERERDDQIEKEQERRREERWSDIMKH